MIKQCSQCGLLLNGWSASDDPWVRHVEESPECSYLEATKGAQWVEDTLNSIKWMSGRWKKRRPRLSRNDKNAILFIESKNGDLVLVIKRDYLLMFFEVVNRLWFTSIIFYLLFLLLWLNPPSGKIDLDIFEMRYN